MLSVTPPKSWKKSVAAAPLTSDPTRGIFSGSGGEMPPAGTYNTEKKKRTVPRAKSSRVRTLQRPQKGGRWKNKLVLFYYIFNLHFILNPISGLLVLSPGREGGGEKRKKKRCWMIPS